MNELAQWLEENKDRLATYSLEEIYDIAIATGQDRIQVAQWFTKSRFDRRAA